MTDLTEPQKAALTLIAAHSKGNEITGKNIANAIGLRQRESGKEGSDLRAIVNALRRKGYPICANGTGYYYPRSRKEIEEYVDSLQGRILKMTEAHDGMRSGLAGWDTRPEVRELPTQQTLIEV